MFIIVIVCVSRVKNYRVILAPEKLLCEQNRYTVFELLFTFNVVVKELKIASLLPVCTIMLFIVLAFGRREDLKFDGLSFIKRMYR